MLSPALIALHTFLEEHDRRVPVGWIGDRVHGGERRVLLEAIARVERFEASEAAPFPAINELKPPCLSA